MISQPGIAHPFALPEVNAIQRHPVAPAHGYGERYFNGPEFGCGIPVPSARFPAHGSPADTLGGSR